MKSLDLASKLPCSPALLWRGSTSQDELARTHFSNAWLYDELKAQSVAYRDDERYTQDRYRLSDVSMIVTCKGRLPFLKQTIHSHLAQAPGEYIIVDYEDGHQSGGWAEANYQGQVKVIRPQATTPGKFNLSHARNVGAKRAKGSVLVFIDADITPKQGWLIHVLNQLGADDNLACYLPDEEKSWDKAGTSAILATTLRSIRGFNEEIDQWGCEDRDAYQRIEKLGKTAHYDADLLYCTRHSDELRMAEVSLETRQQSYDRMWKIARNATLVNPKGWGRLRPDRHVSVVTSVEFDWSLWPHFIDHYRRAGVDDIYMTVCQRQVPGILAILDQLARHDPFPVYLVPASDRWESKGLTMHHTQETVSKYVKADWIVPADLDELHQFPGGNVHATIDILNNEGKDAMTGIFCDRVTADGSLPEVRIDSSLFRQFPMRADVTKSVVDGFITKVLVFNKSCKIDSGHHGCSGNKMTHKDALVHHFKWRHGLLENAKIRRDRYRKAGGDYADCVGAEQIRLIDHLERHGKLDLNNFNLSPSWIPY